MTGLRLFAIIAVGMVPAMHASEVNIAGAATLVPLISEAAKILREEEGMQIRVAEEGSSSLGIRALGSGEAQIAMMSRPVTTDDRTAFPERVFTELPLGKQVVAIGVSNDLWEAGVRALTRAQLRAIYESKIKDWSGVGGPKKPIAFFSFEEGHGTWEAFAQWVYGDNKRAPVSRSPAVTDDAKARGALESHPGAAALISPLLLDGVKAHPLAVQGEEGPAVAPTVENVASNRYPITRPLLLVIDDKPILEVKKFTDFMLGPRGMELMRKRGYLDAATLKSASKP